MTTWTTYHCPRDHRTGRTLAMTQASAPCPECEVEEIAAARTLGAAVVMAASLKSIEGQESAEQDAIAIYLMTWAEWQPQEPDPEPPPQPALVPAGDNGDGPVASAAVESALRY